MQNPVTTDQILDFLQKFRNEFLELRNEVHSLKGEFHEFKNEMYEFKKEMYEFKNETTRRFDEVDKKFVEVDKKSDLTNYRIDEVQKDIQRMDQRYYQDRKIMLALILEVKEQQREQGRMIMDLQKMGLETRNMVMEDREKIRDIWESRDKVTVKFNRKLYVVTASISTVVSAIVSTGISIAFKTI